MCIRDRLYGDGRFPTPSGKARFVLVEHQPLAEPTSADYPVSLSSGRLSDQWHGMSRTGTVPRLFNAEDEPLLHLSPRDVKTYGLEDGGLVRVRNPRGQLVLRVAADGDYRGRAWLPMHWGSRFMNGAGANAFMPGACDPFSGQPELKHAAVALEAAQLPWPLVLIRRVDAQRSLVQLQACARRWLPRFDYATATPGGRQEQYLILRAASAEPLSAAVLVELDADFGLDGDLGVITYADAARHVDKRVKSEQGQLVCLLYTSVRFFPSLPFPS